MQRLSVASFRWMVVGMWVVLFALHALSFVQRHQVVVDVQRSIDECAVQRAR